MAEFVQSSFAGGVFAPTLWPRTELERYPSGLRACLNMLVTEHGSVQSRPGTGHVALAPGVCVIRRFVFSNDQSYVLLFWNHFLAVIYQGGILLQPNGVMVLVATPWAEADLRKLKLAQQGDVVTITCRGYQPQELKRYAHGDWRISAVSFTPLAAWHPAAPALLSWTVKPDDTSRPAKAWQWAVTTVFRDANGHLVESSPSIVAWLRATAVEPFQRGRSYAIGAVVYWNAGRYTCIQAVTGGTNYFQPDMAPAYWTYQGTSANGQSWVTVPQLVPVYTDRPVTVTWDGAGMDGGNFNAWNNLVAYAIGALVTDGSAFYVATAASTGKVPSTEPTFWARLDFGAKPLEVLGRCIYRGRDGVFGYIGEVGPTAVSFIDEGTVPDFSSPPPKGTDPFATYDVNGAVTGHDYPDVVAYFNQRRWFARLGRLVGSCVGDYSKFDVATPARDDQACDFTLAGKAFEEIRSLVGLDILVALSASSEWSIRGSGREEAITPTSVLARASAEAGSSWLDPLVVDDTLLHVTAKSGRIRELAFDAQTGRYGGGDLSLYARHLFDGRSVVDWCFKEDPDSTVWVVLDDGTLLCLTYNRGQKIWGWTSHQTQGVVEAVCCIPEGLEDFVYLVVRRTVQGEERRFVERMSTRSVSDGRLGLFLDCAKTYDGRNVGAGTLAVNGGSEWTGGEEVNVTSSAAIFSASSVGDAVVMNPNSQALGLDEKGEEIPGFPVELTILAVTSPTSATCLLERPLPSAYQNVATTDWAMAVDTLTGLSHLEGREVMALCDGYTAGPYVVTDGSVTLEEPAAIAHVGLSYVQELETLDFVGPPKAHVKAITQVRVELQATVAELEVGETLSDMNEWAQRQVEHDYAPIPLETLEAVVHPSSTWNTKARIAIRNKAPTPMTLLAITREAEVGGR